MGVGIILKATLVVLLLSREATKIGLKFTK